MKNLFLIFIISFLASANQCSSKKKNKVILPSDTNIDNISVLQLQYFRSGEKALLSAILDTVANVKYTLGYKTVENGVYPYHFYTNMVGGGLGGRYCFESSGLRSDSVNLTFLCVLPYIKRSPQLVNTLYSNYKEIFFELVDTSRARKLGLGIMVDDLLFTYDTLFKRKTPKKVFKEYLMGNNFDYDIMLLNHNGPSHHPITKKPRYKPLLRYKEWVYSFWYRRYLEGNLEVCLRILKEVSKRYPAKKETTLRYKEDEHKKEVKTRKKRILTPEETKNNEAIKKILDKIEIFK